MERPDFSTSSKVQPLASYSATVGAGSSGPRRAADRLAAAAAPKRNGRARSVARPIPIAVWDQTRFDCRITLLSSR